MAFNKRSCVYFPIAFLLFASIGICICYAVAIANKHVVDLPNWPFVSDLGGNPPESCVFTLLFNWAALAFLVICVGFYKFVREHGHKTYLNKASLVIGIITSMGVSIVGSFPWTQVFSVHIVGAAMAFIGGIIYCWLLVAISWRYFRLKLYTSLLVCLRIVLVSVQTISLVLFIAFFGVYGLHLDRQRRVVPCTVMEWSLMFSQLIYYASLAFDFNQIRSFKFSLKHVGSETNTRIHPQDSGDIIETSTSSPQDHSEP